MQSEEIKIFSAKWILLIIDQPNIDVNKLFPRLILTIFKFYQFVVSEDLLELFKMIMLKLNQLIYCEAFDLANHFLAIQQLYPLYIKS